MSTSPTEALVTRSLDIEERWGRRQVALIARTVAKGATAEELQMFLRIADRYNLDPLQHEIWCIKTRGRDGSEGRIAIIVGEQGRLKIATRFEDYRGFRSDAVCENDRFVKLAEPKEMSGVPGAWTYVEHSYGKPSERGEVQGAWCEVYREGRPPTFFYAPLAEYMPNPEGMSDKAKKMIPWFSTKSRMIVKCADSTAFRMAFTLAGIYGEEEMEHVQQQGSNGGAPIEEEIEWGETDETAERMKSLFAAANNAEAGAYPPAKIRLLLAGLSDEERAEIAAREIIPFIRAHGGEVPEPGVVVVANDDVEINLSGEDDEPSEEASADEEPPEYDASQEEHDPEADSLPGV